MKVYTVTVMDARPAFRHTTMVHGAYGSREDADNAAIGCRAGDLNKNVRTIVQELELQSLHDFGEGPVPAHQHSNGGGWVADTADVADSVFVGPNARVFGHTQLPRLQVAVA